VGGWRAFPVALIVGCLSAPDNSFRVTWARPDEGDAVRFDARIAVAFSNQADSETCTADTILLRAIDAESRVTLDIPVTLSPLEDADHPFGFQLDHEPLVHDTDHALVVLGGDDGCLSLVGEPISPYMRVFHVTSSDR
jgi:hypothetical protein